MALEVERGFEVQANSHSWASVIWLIAPPASPTALFMALGLMLMVGRHREQARRLQVCLCL
jgi:hypothetical protein